MNIDWDVKAELTHSLVKLDEIERLQAVQIYCISSVIRQSSYLPKQLLFWKGKIGTIAKFYRTDLVI